MAYIPLVVAEEVALGFIFSFVFCNNKIGLQYLSTRMTYLSSRFNETTRLIFISSTQVDQLAFGPVSQPNHLSMLRAGHWGDPAITQIMYIVDMYHRYYVLLN